VTHGWLGYGVDMRHVCSIEARPKRLTCNPYFVKESPFVNCEKKEKLFHTSAHSPQPARTRMPPSGKRAASGGKRKAPSAEEGAGQDEEHEEARGLNTAVVKQFLGKLLHRDRLGPDYFTDVEKQQWNEWLDAVPASAAESVDAKTLLPVQMPRKCLPRPEAGSSSDGLATIGQQEIITYSNAGGRRFGTAQRSRQYAMRKALRLSDVPQGTTIAIQCDPQLGSARGYRTPFWVGDVIEAVGDAATGKLEKVTVHFRMPQAAGGLFCDDVTKPWNLACHAQHTYSKNCERGVKCMAAAREVEAPSAKFTYICEAAEILETKLELNNSNTLKAATKKRLAESAPLSGAWDQQLGI
jgi:hypothetical protein